MTATRVPPVAQQQRNPTLRRKQPPIAVHREGEEIVTRGNGWATPFIRPFVRPFVGPVVRPGASDTGDVKITVGAVTVRVPLALAPETGLVVEVDHRSQPATSRDLLADSWSSLRDLWRFVFFEKATLYDEPISRSSLLIEILVYVFLGHIAWWLLKVLA